MNFVNVVEKHRLKLSMLAAAALLTSLAPRAKGDTYVQTNLVSDVPGLAVTTDPNLVNPWGMANSATSPYWISDQGTNVSTLYNGLGTPSALIVTVPPVTPPPTGPTGIVFNNTGQFVVGAAPATFIFATLAGSIDGWNGAAGSTAVVEVPRSAGTVLTGLTLGNNGTGNFLYAADFATGGGIRVYSSTFASTALAGSFTDPNLPAGYAPYNIQNIGGKLYVTYAEVGTGGAATGAGLGIVDVYDLNGNFLQRLISNGGQLNAPWGEVVAPSGFGEFSNDLLVGNFGNGQINAFDPTTGAYVGTLDGPGGSPLVNFGLWSLEFGNGNAGSSPTTLFFTAGIDHETEGLFGSIMVPEPSSLMLLGVGLLGIMGAAMWKRRVQQ